MVLGSTSIWHDYLPSDEANVGRESWLSSTDDELRLQMLSSVHRYSLSNGNNDEPVFAAEGVCSHLPRHARWKPTHHPVGGFDA